MDTGPVPQDDWSGPRPLALRRPFVAVAALALVLVAALFVAVRRDVDIPAQVAAHYVDLMAGALPLEAKDSDPEALARALAAQGAGFLPAIRPLDPAFALLGGGVHRLADREGAYWYYRDARSDMVLVEAFTAALDELGPAADIRETPPPALYVFRKTTQTLVFWAEGHQVYAMTSTLPGERVIALARRAAPGGKDVR